MGMENTTRNSFGARILSSSVARLGMLLFLVIVLLIPLNLIRGTVEERSARRSEAIDDITSSWGGPQAVVGPLIRVRCVEREIVKDAQGWTQERVTTTAIHVLPERLRIDATLDTEIRRRGLFDVPVYAAQLALRGEFAQPDLSLCPGRATSIDWSNAQLLLALRQPRGLRADAQLSWNRSPLSLKPATGIDAAVVASGIHAPLPAPDQAWVDGRSTFAIELGFNGAQSLQFAPVAKETRVAMHANWPHPSFYGGWLPGARQMSADAFSAQWSMSYLGRDYPQVLVAVAEYNDAIEKSLFGVQLVQPVDTYVMAERITKYAVLTLLFTFLTVWLTEVLSGKTVHPIQYGFIGAALCLFGLLQLALAEHIGFTAAFALAVTAVTALVTLYCRSVLGRLRRAIGVGAVLVGLYGYLYSLLRAEDYALLGGALALFALLASAMYLTRRVDWSGSSAGPSAR